MANVERLSSLVDNAAEISTLGAAIARAIVMDDRAGVRGDIAALRANLQIVSDFLKETNP